MEMARQERELHRLPSQSVWRCVESLTLTVTGPFKPLWHVRVKYMGWESLPVK